MLAVLYKLLELIVQAVLPSAVALFSTWGAKHVKSAVYLVLFICTVLGAGYFVWSWKQTQCVSAEASRTVQVQSATIEAMNVVREKENLATARLEALEKEYSTYRETQNEKANKLTNDLRTARVRLSIPGTSTACTGTVQGATSGTNAGGEVELPREIAGDLSSLAAEADRVTVKLTALQQYVLEVQRMQLEQELNKERVNE